MSLASAAALRTSETVTCAPLRRRKSAAARPDLPSPTTRTFLPLSSMLTSLEGHCGQREVGTERLSPASSRTGHCCTFDAVFIALEGGECKECKHQGADPELGDHLRLRPAHQLEVRRGPG